jgi:hypothetical protein
MFCLRWARNMLRVMEAVISVEARRQTHSEVERGPAWELVPLECKARGGGEVERMLDWRNKPSRVLKSGSARRARFWVCGKGKERGLRSDDLEDVKIYECTIIVWMALILKVLLSCTGLDHYAMGSFQQFVPPQLEHCGM